MKIIKEIDQYDNFSELLSDAAKVFGDRTFIIDEGRMCSFREFNALVNRCCHMLSSEGVAKGNIVSMVLKNSLSYLVVYFASLRLGCQINPFPFHLGPEEIVEKVSFMQPKIIFAHTLHADKLKAAGFPVRVIQSDKEPFLLEAALKLFSAQSFAGERVDPDETAFLYYSSGTTGQPKIIEYTTRSEIMSMASLLRAGFMINPPTCHLCVLPLGHTAAIRYTIWPCLLTGSIVVLYESFWKIRMQLWELIEKHKISFVEIVPSILISILNTPYKDLAKRDLSSLKFIGCGSAYLPKNLQEKFEETFKVPLANMYGLSETGATHFDNPFLAGRQTGTVGKALDIMDIKVFDENGNDVPAGTVGEFGVKGPSLLKGYYKSSEQYRACFNKAGYFVTGDLGYVDAGGIYYYVDRKKDLIIKGGVNIVPSQIDEALLAHAAVQDAATVGKPDMFLGEVIKSFVVLKSGENVDAKTLKTHCKNLLGDFKTPSEIEFVDELPKGPSGKVLRRKLREKEFAKIS